MFEFTKYPLNFSYERKGFALYFFFGVLNKKSILFEKKIVRLYSEKNPFTSVPEWGRKI